jgi:hypothetical protein
LHSRPLPSAFPAIAGQELVRGLTCSETRNPPSRSRLSYTTYIVDHRGESPPTYTVQTSTQNRLVQADSPPPTQEVSQPAFIVKHSYQSSTYMHDYTMHDRMLFRLAQATWPSGKSLHCVSTADIRLTIRKPNNFVIERLGHWISSRIQRTRQLAMATHLGLL